jgi:tetratricopeptide (TPR) repeat protein/transcriptional regulator with XRE-family HTH domain
MAGKGLPEGSFAALLRTCRRAANLTQEQLAERAGLSVHTISTLERGVHDAPHPHTVESLAEALQLDPARREAFVAAARGLPAAGPNGTRSLPPEPRAGLPPDQVLHFVGRERELAELERSLRQAGRVTIHGLGGVGKTQLAASHLSRCAGDYPDGVFWLRAEHPGDLAGDLASLAWRLDLPEREAPEQERQIEAVLRWLRAHPGWLLVLDNVEPEAEEDAWHWLPPGLPGHILVTSRAPIGAARLRLEPLPLDVAAAFLLRRTGQSDAEAAGAVAQTLGCLPLALEQAAAYVEASGRDLAGYADLLGSRLLELMDEGRPDRYRRTVATTWQLSFERMSSERPAAAGLLRLCAVLAPDDIPVEVLRRAAPRLPAELERAVADEVEFDRTVAAARRYALVERRGDAIAVHRLVQAVVLGSMAPEERRDSLGAAVRLLRASFPDRAHEQPEHWTLCDRLLSHVQAVDLLAGADPPEPAALGWLLDRVGGYLDGRAEFARARPLLERALSIREAVLGPDHPDTAETLDDLAGLLTHIGDLDGARPRYDRALDIRERTVGPDHPETATSLNNVAVLLHRQGDLAGARARYERAMRIDARMLGPYHPHIAKDLNNLARLLREQGDAAAAEPLFERALDIAEHTAGPDHPLTATSLNNLAQLLRDVGRLDEARPLLERSLGIFQRVLGEDHPHTAVALVNLSGLLREQGEIAAAGPLAERALKVQERVLGSDHADVATGLANLALVLQCEGDLRRACALLRRAMGLREGRPGPDDRLMAAARAALREVETAGACP